MANPPHGPQPGDLSLRLRALRREHPSLAVLTEIIHLDEQRVTFRATVRIDGETRAQGHAAQGTDRAGTFVAAAERLAVEQALLLGGFAAVDDESTAQAARIESIPPVLTPAQPELESEPVAADNVTPPAMRRRPRANRPARQSVSPPAAIDATDDEPTPESDDSAATTPADMPTNATSLPPGVVADTAGAGQPSAAATPPATAANTEDATNDADAPAEPSAPRRKRDRRAERDRARVRQSETASPDGTDRMTEPGTPVPASEALLPLLEQSPLPLEEAPPAEPQAIPGNGRISETPRDAAEPSPAKPRRRATARAGADPPAEPASSAPDTHETIRAAWQAGRPIPAWWPLDRIAVEKPLTKAQVERLRATAIEEEITPAQLDSYSTMLFGSAVAGLNQAQGAILEERLNPAYPSPLQELSARRLLHPIAVGDTVTIPEDQPIFIRWRDVPPVVEPPEPPPPTVPSWRLKRVPARRRR